MSNDILNSHREIFTKNIRVLYNFYEKHKEKILSEINSKIEDTNASERLSEQHYANLKNQISIYLKIFLRKD